MTISKRSFVSMMVMLAAFSSVLAAQDPLTQTQLAPADAIEQLRLTPEQRQKIRQIREDTKNERAAINQRLREANIALEQALDVDNPDEALVEQRLRDAAAAHAASLRMRIQTEMKIRRVLTQEQVATLRLLRMQARGVFLDQQMQRPNRRDALRPNRRNGIAPLFPRRNPLPNRRP